ncbi:hypothetical protein CI109_103199 [Kwoniella shandongensis]|uniref:non-specific serine/threonine protein kinase n=1 Tax=Kwoniella shandongensis TaxID=1734106 RepID=A0AAJ8MWM4_9TREE
MSMLGGRVTTYGRKKTQIISVLSDARLEPHDQTLSPLPAVKSRPPLQTKVSQDIINIPSTPIPAHRSKPFKPSQLAESRVVSRSPTPDAVLKPRKVPRVVRRAVIVPHSSPAALSPARRTPAKGQDVLEGVVIPIKSSAKKPTTSGKGVRGLTSKLARVTIEDSPAPTERSIKPPQPKDTLPLLLKQCTSTIIQPFATILNSSDIPSFTGLTKVGEASYSEVFGLTTTSSTNNAVDFVLKIIPLLDEQSREATSKDGPMPDCSSPEDVAREIEVTKTMGQVPGGGFVKFQGAYIVEGEYPAELLEQWDTFKRTLGSASVRPSKLPSSQKYCLIALSHAGLDLESFKFDIARGWIQAAGVFWQIVASLARAEEWTKFEHRDLHEGQILISLITPSEEDDSASQSLGNYLDAAYTGVETTIIDFGLSRLDLQSGSTPNAIWTSVPEEVYEGKGAQWDLYRAMRDRIEGKWEVFHPITNVMWLHYIVRYMLDSKSIRKPRPPQASSRRSRTKATIVYEQNDRAHQMLLQAEKVLSWSVDFDMGGAGKRTRRGLRGEPEGEKLGHAQEILEWGKKEGWVA